MIQFVVIVVHTSDAEFYVTIASIPVIILILMVAGISTRRESFLGMLATIVRLLRAPGTSRNSNCNLVQILYFVALAYFIFKLVRMYEPHYKQHYLPVRKSLTIFAVITIILIILTITNAIMCTANFGRGLKPHIAGRKVESEEEKAHMTEMPSLSHAPVPSRMTID